MGVKLFTLRQNSPGRPHGQGLLFVGRKTTFLFVVRWVGPIQVLSVQGQTLCLYPPSLNNFQNPGCLLSWGMMRGGQPCSVLKRKSQTFFLSLGKVLLSGCFSHCHTVSLAVWPGMCWTWRCAPCSRTADNFSVKPHTVFGWHLKFYR